MSRGVMTAFWLVLAACTGPASSPGGASVCETSAKEAEKRVTSVIPGHLECTADDDCQAVMVMASCFNDCAASLNRAGAGAVDRASTLVEAHECKMFGEAGCASKPPSCEAPGKPVCTAGKCAF